MKMGQHLLNVKEMTWADCRNVVKKDNPALANAIDQAPISKKHVFYECEYAYGANLLVNSKLHLPKKSGEVVPFSDPGISPRIREALGYNLGSNPVGIVVDNCFELFIDLGTRIISYALLRPGNIIGLWKTLDQGVSHCPETDLWGMTAGARSTVMLPKVAEADKYQRMSQELKIHVDKPSGLLDHASIFKEIASSKRIDKPWTAKILFFSKEWFEDLRERQWLEFYNYLLETVVSSGSFWRNQYLWDLIFSMIQNRRGVKPSSYIADMVKHLFALGVGALPGMSPAIDDSVAPVSLIQEVYTNVYGLKKYAPIIMQPNYFSVDKADRPIYYSTQFPTAIEFSPKNNDRSSTAADLYLAQSFLTKCLSEISSGDLQLSETSFMKLSENIKYDFFHSDIGKYHEISESSQMPSGDKAFSRLLINADNGLSFPENGPFVRGCVRLSHKKS